MLKFKSKLTGAGHGGRVSLGTEVVLLTATVQRPLMMRETMRRTLGTLHISECRFVEACPAHWRQKNIDRCMSVMLNQHIDSYLIAASFVRAPTTRASK